MNAPTTPTLPPPRRCYVVGGPKRRTVERKVYPSLRAFGLQPVGAHTMDRGKRLTVPDGVDLIVFLTDCVSHSLGAQLPKNSEVVQTRMVPDQILAALSSHGLMPIRPAKDKDGRTWRVAEAGDAVVVQSPGGHTTVFKHKTPQEARRWVAAQSETLTPDDIEITQSDSEEDITMDTDTIYANILNTLDTRGWSPGRRITLAECIVTIIRAPWERPHTKEVRIIKDRVQKFFNPWPRFVKNSNWMDLNEGAWRQEAARFGVSVPGWSTDDRKRFHSASVALINAHKAERSQQLRDSHRRRAAAKATAKTPKPKIPKQAPPTSAPTAPVTATPAPAWPVNAGEAFARLRQRLDTPEVRLVLGRPLTEEDVNAVLERQAERALAALGGAA